MSIRIHHLARELGMSALDLLHHVQGRGVDVGTVSNAIPNQIALELRKEFARDVSPLGRMQLRVSGCKLLDRLLLSEPVLDDAPLFTTVADIATKLALLPNPTYSKPRSTEALLSQVLRFQKPLPDALREELRRYFKKITGDEIRKYVILHRALNEIADAHNRTVRENAANFRKPTGEQELWQTASALNATQHFLILSLAALDENFHAFRTVLEAQGAGLKIFDPTWSSFPYLSNFGNSGDSPDTMIWGADVSEINFLYVVPSQATAYLLWNWFFRSIYAEYRPWDELWGFDITQDMGTATKTQERNEKAHKEWSKCSAGDLRKADAGGNLQVWILAEPLNALCANASIAINPSDHTECSVFSLVGGAVTKMSPTEVHSWRQLVYDLKPQLFGQAKRLTWMEVEADVLKQNSTYDSDLYGAVMKSYR